MGHLHTPKSLTAYGFLPSRHCHITSYVFFLFASALFLPSLLSTRRQFHKGGNICVFSLLNGCTPNSLLTRYVLEKYMQVKRNDFTHSPHNYNQVTLRAGIWMKKFLFLPSASEKDQLYDIACSFLCHLYPFTTHFTLTSQKKPQKTKKT